MRNLKSQLWLSHLVLVGMMAVVSLAATITFRRLGHQVDRILQDNYKSVVAAQEMKEALERIDSAANFHLSGRTEKARTQFHANVLQFERAYRVEAGNITETGEQALADAIGREFPNYKRAVERLLGDPHDLNDDTNRTTYFRQLEPLFRSIKERAQRVLEINQAAILRADAKAKLEAERASAWSTGLSILSLLLAVLFVRWVVRASLSPIRALATQAEEIGKGHLNQRIELRRNDEIGALAASFNNMAQSLQTARSAERLRLARAERMGDEAIDSLYDPVLVADASGKLVHMNPAAEELFGPSELATSRQFRDVVGHQQVSDAVTRAIRKSQVTSLEEPSQFLHMQHPLGERVYRMRVTPMLSEQDVLGAVAVLEDVTHLQQLDRMKTEFIGVASHELKTPVTSLLLAVELMQEGSLGALTPSQQEVIDGQREDLGRLQTTIRDLLDVTRLESGMTPLVRKPVKISEIISDSVRALSGEAGEKQISVSTSCDESAVIEVDRLQIGRVLANLLGNAIRHTPIGGTVQVTVTESGSFAEISVSDSGEGIPSEYLDTVFDRFVQVPGATQGGSGLGLSIARKIVEAHGGRIWATSEPDRGATIRFTVPLHLNNESPNTPGAEDGTHSRN